jgi:hypothetical protein
MAHPIVTNWREVLARAWSMWAIAVSIVLGAVEAFPGRVKAH